MSIKVLGGFLGNTTECSQRLLARVETHLQPLAKVSLLRDFGKCDVALQVQLQINRFCANTSLTYFMRVMGGAASRCAAYRHDALVEAAFHAIVGTGAATQAERSRAVQQARLPVKMGGLGLSAMGEHLDAACVGSWALCWHQMRRLCPQIFAHIDITQFPLPALKELRAAHKSILDVQRKMQQTYDALDHKYYDYDKAGEGHVPFHPSHLPQAHKFLPLAAYAQESKLLLSAQRECSLVLHHAAWLKFATRLRGGAPRREAVRFIAVSQPYAGAYLNAVPKYSAFRLPSPLLRIAVQRRLGLPLLEAAAAAGKRSRHGREFDVLGDVAQNDGKEGHATRHCLVLAAIYDAIRRVAGSSSLEHEPTNYRGYSDHRPDLTTSYSGFKIWDLKLLDPFGSKPALDMSARGAFVGFGNTACRAREMVRGREARGRAGDGAFSPLTGAGEVSAIPGDYARAQRLGHTVGEMLVETTGGIGPALLELLKGAAEARANKLTHGEYETEATWSTRKYMPFVMQRISVAVQLAAASEIRLAMGVGQATAVA